MLTLEQIQKNKYSFLELLSKLNVDLTELYKYLDGKGFFDAPLTATAAQSYRGGLCENALKLYYELHVLCNAYRPGVYSEEDIIKVALFKNFYRVEMYELIVKNRKNPETNQWEEYNAYQIKQERVTFGDLGFSSYMLAKHFLDFTDEQTEAICYGSATASGVTDIHDVLRSYPLVTLTRMADLACNYLDFNNVENKNE